MSDLKTLGWPIICSSVFKNLPFISCLGQKHKLKFSESILERTIIFPLSSIAFMIINLQDSAFEWPPTSEENEVDKTTMERLEKFSALHRNCYLILVSSSYESKEWSVLTKIQTKFIGSQMQILPARSEAECVQIMTTIAKATCKPACSVLRSRLNFLLSQHKGEEKVLQILAETGLCEHDCLVLQQGCETLSKIAVASEEQLLNCSLDSAAVDSLQDFFQKDSF